MHTFYTKSNREAYKKIQNGEFKASILRTLRRVDIDWGGAVDGDGTMVTSQNVCDLFTLDTKEEHITGRKMKRPIQSRLTRVFKKLIIDTYKEYEEEKNHEITE